MVLAFCLPAAAQDADLTGRYRVEGSNPGGTGQYKGEAAVIRTGETYQVVWRLGGQEYRGTGVVRDGGLAVVYQVGGQSPGVVLYRVMANGSLSGTWVGLGGEALGSEVWNPSDRS
jgi:hypothetical protein